jgi:hypothetical protein
LPVIELGLKTLNGPPFGLLSSSCIQLRSWMRSAFVFYSDLLKRSFAVYTSDWRDHAQVLQDLQQTTRNLLFYSFSHHINEVVVG